MTSHSTAAPGPSSATPGTPRLPRLPRLPPLILACLAATWLIWGSTYLAIKWALVSFPPFYQMGTRFLVAGALLAAWLTWRGSRWPDRREWINATVLGSLMLGVAYGLTAVAEVSVSSGLVVVFIAIGPALQAAMELPYGVRPTKLESAGIALGLAGVLWLAKFAAAGDTLDVAWAESCTLQMAGRCGLAVPEVKVIDIGGKSVLLVRRFDRQWLAPFANAKPLEQRLPFVSGLTLVACDEFDSRLKGYGHLAQAIREHVHPSLIRANCEELFGRMVFNIFVSNDDDHLRNHGFVRDAQLPGWALSPLYDVVPRPNVAFERQLHLQVGQQGKLATLDNAMSAYSAFVPQRTTAVAIIRRVWGELRQWRTTFESLGAGNPGMGRLLDQLAPAMRSLEDIASPTLQAEIHKSQQ